MPEPSTTACWIRLAPLALPADVAEACANWLGEAEWQRLQRIGNARRRQQFLAGHWQVRELASTAWGGEPAHWRLQPRAGGGWCFESGIAGHLSLSHSGDWIAAAVANAPVGVDLELPSGPRDFLALAAFVFSTEECRWLAAQLEHERERAFLTLWSLKEARGKCGGQGLQPRQARRSTARACAPAAAQALSWSCAGGALAVCGEVDAVQLLSPAELCQSAAQGWRFSEADQAGS